MASREFRFRFDVVLDLLRAERALVAGPSTQDNKNSFALGRYVTQAHTLTVQGVEREIRRFVTHFRRSGSH